jgi:hypothetical protein
VSAVTPVAAADGVAFAPHRAVYEIELSNSTAGSGVADMSGRMVYELNGSTCDGYTQNMRFVTRMTNQDGAETINDLRSSSWEEAGGKRLRFSSSQYQNDKIAEASQGDAMRDAGKPSVSVDLVKPGKKRLRLPEDVYFPMQHAEAVLAAARRGTKIFPANLYDGSENGGKVYATTSIIGKKFAQGPVKEFANFKDAARLSGVDSWPMSISYFELGKNKQDSPPAYEISYRYFENGVTSDLKIDYGDFAIKGTLKDLTFLDVGKCSATAH